MKLNLTAEPSVECDLGVIESYLPGWALPKTFSATWNDPVFPVVITMDVEVEAGLPRCVALHLKSKGDGQVDGTAIRRVPVATLLDYAVGYAVMPESHRKLPDGRVVRTVRFKSPQDFQVFRALHQPHRNRERWQLTPEHLAEVVRIYRAATDGAPVQAVAAHFNKPRPTASRWIAQARSEGYFDQPSSTPKKKGKKP